jgi:erythromycin esterase-like protein
MSKNLDDFELAAVLKSIAIPLRRDPHDYDALLDLVGDARIVMLGEASHGTHEFYHERAMITKRLIAERGFSAVAVEADWPDAYRVNRFIRDASDDADAIDALADFERFPTWMWRNADVLDFVGWLRAYNDTLPHRHHQVRKAGFYGLDLYSLRASMDAVLEYVGKVDPPAAARLQELYACFDRFGPDMESYSLAVGAGLSASCEREVVDAMLALHARRAQYARADGRVAEDEFFYAEQNARIAKNAEQYYRTMISPGVSSWNLRDSHMADTLERLLSHLDRHQEGTKIVVWAHNSHIGDARATDMSYRAEHNIGQLVRTRFGPQCVLVGLTTHDGTVTAASGWYGPAERKRVRPGLPFSYEAALHLTGLERLFLNLRDDGARKAELFEPRLERFIGVIYLPETERQSHYSHARLAAQFDALIHIDRTRAVEPLERTAHWEVPEVPETFPTGV